MAALTCERLEKEFHNKSCVKLHFYDNRDPPRNTPLEVVWVLLVPVLMSCVLGCRGEKKKSVLVSLKL